MSVVADQSTHARVASRLAITQEAGMCDGPYPVLDPPTRCARSPRWRTELGGLLTEPTLDTRDLCTSCWAMMVLVIGVVGDPGNQPIRVWSWKEMPFIIDGGNEKEEEGPAVETTAGIGDVARRGEVRGFVPPVPATGEGDS